MKKMYNVFLLICLASISLMSCSDDNNIDDSENVNKEDIDKNAKILNLSGNNFCGIDETIKFKASIKHSPNTSFYWSLNEKIVSQDSIYKFSANKAGIYTVGLIHTNGTDSISCSVNINVFEGDDKSFNFSKILNWTGDGENMSALSIQWVKSDNIENPEDKDIHHLVWGYRWSDASKTSGMDMIKDIAKNDPRFFIIINNTAISAFIYDGNNDGKINIKNSTLSLTETDFVNGIYEQKSGDNIDDLICENKDDMCMGGWTKSYNSYWIGSNAYNCPKKYSYAQTGATDRTLENFSWDAWTMSYINNQHNNVEPKPELIKAAEADK